MYKIYWNKMLLELDNREDLARHSLLVLVTFFLITFIFFWRRTLSKSLKSWNLNSFSGISRIPGPGYIKSLKLLSLHNFLPTMVQWSRDFQDTFKIKLGPYSVVCLNSPTAIQKLLSNKEGNHLSKPLVYDVLRPFLDDGVLLSKGEKWRSRRKILTSHMFSYKSLSEYAKIINEEANHCVHLLANVTPNQSCVSIDGMLHKSSLNVIAQIVLGGKADAFDLKGANEDKLLDIVKTAKQIVMKRLLNPWLLFERLWVLHPLYKIQQDIVNYKNQLLDGNLDSDLPFKEGLLAAGVPMDGIIEEAFTQLLVGFETTANGLQFLLFLLAIHPVYQEKCHQEIDKLFEEIGDEIIPFNALNKLTYLEMCLNETLRLLPLVPIVFRKTSSSLNLGNDIVLPPNSTVGVNIYGIHRNPKYYPNPEQFDPERFSPEAVKERHPYAFLPFSSGVRKCVGYKLALLQMMVFAANILRHYHLSSDQKFEDIVMLPEILLSPETPMKLVIKKRR